jgi:ArsR family transcriptional regulator
LTYIDTKHKISYEHGYNRGIDMKKKYTHETAIFKALSDENRLEIIELLSNGEKCGCVLLEKLDIQQPTLSHHMKILCETGLVNRYKAGKWIHYSLSESAAETIKRLARLFDVAVEKNVHNSMCKECDTE